ncbi:unnamed protein product [Symbiodinium sp. KB8]|nr:unnamed protein product [Symbiodinium sp. KB8]
MSQRFTSVRVSVDGSEVEVRVRPRIGASSGDDAAEWELVEAPEEGADEPLPELAPSRAGPPLHLLRRSRLAPRGDWTPEKRIVRAYELGQSDGESALEGGRQRPSEPFPFQNSVYVILYDSSGEWPRVTRSSKRYFEAVKDKTGRWKPGLVSRAFPSLVEAEAYCLGGDDVDLLLLKWPMDSDNLFLAMPLRVCTQGVILAVPMTTIPAEELEEAMDAGEDNLVGPNTVTTVSVQGGDDESELIDVRIVELGMSIRSHLEKKGARTRRPFTAFVANQRILPSIRELNDFVEGWLESAEGRLEDYFTAQEEAAARDPDPGGSAAILAQLQEMQEAMSQRFALLEGRVDHLQAPEGARNRTRAAEPARPSGGEGGKGARGRMEEMLAGVREQVSPAPRREPGRTGETAADIATQALATNLDGDLMTTSTDDLIKIALLKSLKGKGRKSKRLPGLPSWEESSSDSDEKDSGWTSTSRGGRGIEAVERLNAAMKQHPQAYLERMEGKMVRAVGSAELGPTVPLEYVKACPVGKARTAGYCLQGFAQVHKLMLENKPRLARLQTLRMMAALEQFLIDENWSVASRVTGMEEPPWGHWATQDLAAIRRQFVYTRMVEATWVGALINELKEEEWLAKKRMATPKPKAKGSGKDQRSEENV